MCTLGVFGPPPGFWRRRLLARFLETILLRAIRDEIPPRPSPPYSLLAKKVQMWHWALRMEGKARDPFFRMDWWEWNWRKTDKKLFFPGVGWGVSFLAHSSKTWAVDKRGSIALLPHLYINSILMRKRRNNVWHHADSCQFLRLTRDFSRNYGWLGYTYFYCSPAKKLLVSSCVPLCGVFLFSHTEAPKYILLNSHPFPSISSAQYANALSPSPTFTLSLSRFEQIQFRGPSFPLLYLCMLLQYPKMLPKKIQNTRSAWEPSGKDFSPVLFIFMLSNLCQKRKDSDREEINFRFGSFVLFPSP